MSESSKNRGPIRIEGYTVEMKHRTMHPRAPHTRKVMKMGDTLEYMIYKEGHLVASVEAKYIKKHGVHVAYVDGYDNLGVLLCGLRCSGATKLEVINQMRKNIRIVVENLKVYLEAENAN